MAKNEGYRNYELEENVVKLIDSQKREYGISKDFTVNKAIQYFFDNREVGKKGYEYHFETKGRSSVYFYLQKQNHDLLSDESKLGGKNTPFNWIINEAVKFYLNNRV